MQSDQTKITLLYTSDVHGNAMPISYGTNEEADLGLAKYATVVRRTRQENDHVIVLDNGDLIQGTPFMTHYVKAHSERKNPMIQMMNKIGIDASVIGNHEFNFGKRILENAVSESNFPWLSANTLNKETDEPFFGSPYIIKTLDNGVRVAIIGVTTHYIPNWEAPANIENLRFADAKKTLGKWVQHVRATEKPDILIASYHGGFERDVETGEATEILTGENQGYEMCQDIDGIDVLLTGHQHRVLTGKINDVLVIQPGNNGKMYGKITLELQNDNNTWQLTDKRAEVCSLEGAETDESFIDDISELEASTQKWLDEPVGYVDGDMTISDPFQARLQKHPLIEFIQQVQMDATGVDISVSSLLNNDSKGFAPVVTMRDVVSNYMFPNTLVVLELTGQDIKDALEKTATYFTLDDHGDITVNPAFITPKPQHYNYDMWEGINYTIHVSEPVGSRVKHITYHNEALDADKTYHVVLNNYRASGGGDYTMFREKPIVKEDQRDTVELIQAYFEKHQTVKAQKTDNFRVKK